MRKVWVPQYFANSLLSLAKQVLAPSVFNARGVKGLRMMNLGLLMDLDELRKNLGLPIIVNNDSRTQSGLRDEAYYGSYEKYFASWSQHKYGNAIDFVVIGMAAPDVRKHILENKELYPHITFLEVGLIPHAVGGVSMPPVPMSWVHISSQMLLEGSEDILLWSPLYGYVTEQKVIDENL